jgi:hypothetical protein
MACKRTWYGGAFRAVLSVPRARGVRHTKLSPFGAALLAWGGVALLNAALILRLPLPPAGLGIRLRHHAFDAGMLLGAGVVLATIALAWSRFGPRRRGLTALAIAAVSTAAGALLLAADLDGVAERLAGEEAAAGVALGLVALAGLALATAWLVGRWLARPIRRWLAVLVAVLVSLANAFVLRDDYPGVHLFLLLGAVVLAGAALVGTPFVALRTGPRAAAVSILALWGGGCWLVPPGDAVLTELHRLDTAVFVPVLTRIRQPTITAAPTAGLGEWFTSRSGKPALRASTPRFLRDDAVVLLLSIDSVRADLLEEPRHAARLPRLRRLRDESLWFPRAMSPSSGTRSTLAAVFSGRYFSMLRWTPPLSRRPRLDRDTSDRFPELLRRAGVRTATVVSERRGLVRRTGVVRGFDVERVLDAPRGQQFALAPAMTDALIEIIARRRKGKLFAFAHYMDPHAPYDSTAASGSPFDRYLAEVAVVDHEIGRLLDALRAQGLEKKTLLIVTSDHGEAFGQHNTPHHNRTLYEELIRVPLILHARGTRARRIEAPIVSLIDLGPTILDAFGIAVPAELLGQSLVPFLRGERPSLTRPLIAETWFSRAMLFGDGLKAISDQRKGTRELYDLRADPREENNLCDERPRECARRLGILEGFFAAHGAPPGSAAARR